MKYRNAVQCSVSLTFVVQNTVSLDTGVFIKPCHLQSHEIVLHEYPVVYEVMLNMFSMFCSFVVNVLRM